MPAEPPPPKVVNKVVPLPDLKVISGEAVAVATDLKVTSRVVVVVAAAAPDLKR